ncbi:MAG: glycoside hydrolase family 16 protein [Bacteroidetes bacterium]|nr:glycoside hydrolase family 16 protein [Bacteroidota bacterium]
MRYLLFLFLFIGFNGLAQSLQDDFEGNGNISAWFGDDCNVDAAKANPHQMASNNSATVLEYHDVGGQYANVRFDASQNLNMANHSVFQVKVYVPSSGLTGNQNNQISCKLQDGGQANPWQTQTEIIKPLLLDQWQTITFDFANDPFINLDPTSSDPIQRSDLNRVLFQLNGENNNDEVLAYLDDFIYLDTSFANPAPVFNQLVWSDEFNGSGAIDTSKWFHQTILPNGSSWFNGEVQHYTDRTTNSSLSNGTMKLIAKQETYTNQGVTKQYTSARLNSKFAFTYGRVEIRAILPQGVGTWPAMWMLGQNITENGAYWEQQGYGTTPWPACGEIDIMEHWGSNQDYISSAMHTPSSFGGTVNHGGRSIAGVSNTFHVYALEWTPTKMVFSVDSVVHYVYQPSVRDANTWPFDDPQYILLNIAIEPGIDPSFTEDTMEIDYIRVYQAANIGTVEERVLDQNLEAFPNPVHDQMQIKVPASMQGDLVLELYSAGGLLLKEYKYDQYSSVIDLKDLDQLKRGIYHLKLINDEQSRSLSFSKL